MHKGMNQKAIWIGDDMTFPARHVPARIITAHRIASIITLACVSCGGENSGQSDAYVVPPPFSSASSPPLPNPSPVASVITSTVATFDAAWSMDLLTADRILVAERGDVSVQEPGKLWVLTTSGQRTEVPRMPQNTGIYFVLSFTFPRLSHHGSSIY